MATNQELTELLALDLGITIINRRPHAKEIFKWQDLDLLPHASKDTLLCEVYEWNGRNWRTTSNNLIGFIFQAHDLPQIKSQLEGVPRHHALIPDFEFKKEHIMELGFSIPSLFKIGFKGNLKNAKELSIKVNNVTKSRITNIDPPGLEIMRALSEFSQKKPKTYRKNIKSNYLTRALFYAESVEVSLEKEAGVDLDITFETSGVEVEVKTETSTKKEIQLKYSGNSAPFAATFIKGKEFIL